MAILTEKDRKYTSPEDICAHLGDNYADFNGAIIPPIFQSSLFVQHTETNGVGEHPYTYSRSENPTLEVAEKKIAALEGGDGALVFSSGMGAMSAAIMHFVRAGCHVVLVGTCYVGANTFIREYLHNKFNISFTAVHGGDIKEIEDAIRPETALIYLESPSTFVFHMQDLEAIARIAKERGIGTVIDNTYATPLHQQPLKHGIDIVCHSITKYLSGHSDVMGGVLVANEEIIRSVQANERVLIGAVMDPHQAYLLTRGIRTLPLRLAQHGENGKRVAAFLESHPKIERVFYPGSESFAQKELFEKYLSGTNGLMSFIPKGTEAQVQKLVNSLHYFQNGFSWGGFESLVTYVGSPERGHLIRMHVGLESVDSLIDDLKNALDSYDKE